MILLDPTRRRHAAVLARAGCAASALAFGIGLVGGLSTDIRPAAAAEGGVARITEPGDSTIGGAPLTSGDGATQFQLALPTGAACTGDTATGSYSVYGYMIAGALDPNDLEFGSEGPTPLDLTNASTFTAPLWDVNGLPLANLQTNVAEDDDGPGLIANLPVFHLLPLTEAGVTPTTGDYNIGIACWRTATAAEPDPVLDKFWNATLELTYDAAAAGAAKVEWTAPLATTIQFTVDPEDEAEEGEAVELTARMVPDDAEGTITFKDDGDALGAAVALNDRGVATLEVDDLDVGDHTLTAEFTPAAGSEFAASVSSAIDYEIAELGAGGTTTSTTSGGSTTSTTGGGSTTSTTTGASSSTTSTTQASGGPRTNTAGDLARTGFSFGIAVWGLLAIALGRMAMLLGRPTKVKGQ